MYERGKMAGEPPRVLIADDEEQTRAGLSTLIQRVYIQLPMAQAANGLQAWECLATFSSIALAFIDVHMPGIDGLEVCRRARAADITTKIVIISGFKDFEYARQALRYHVTDYLLKPVNPAEVLALVRAMIETTPPQESHRVEQDGERVPLLIEHVQAWVHDHLDQEITLLDLAEKFHYSPNYLGALFKKSLGKGFQDYLLGCRMQRAATLLQNPSLRTAEIAAHVGYTNAKAFSAAFRKTFGLLPGEYRETYHNQSSNP
jgi:YesN/AraC family two-component response regulator